MIGNSTEEYSTTISWWSDKRNKLNSGVRWSGIFSILISVIVFRIRDTSLQINLQTLFIALFIYILYIGIINFLILIFELIDRQFQIRFITSKKEILFLSFYYFSLTLPFLYPLFIISLNF